MKPDTQKNDGQRFAPHHAFRRGAITVLLVLMLVVAAPWAILAGLFHEPAVVLAFVVVACFLLARWRKNQQWRIAAYTSVVVLVWVGLFAPGAMFNRPTLHTERFERIHYGLAVAQVEQLLGGPPGNYGRYSAYRASMRAEGFPGPSGSELLVWSDDDSEIEVAVRDDHVLAAHERARYERNKTFSNRLRRIFEFRRIGPPDRLVRSQGDDPPRTRFPGATPTTKPLAVPADKPTRFVPLSSCTPRLTVVKHWSDEDRSLAAGPGGEVWFVSAGGRMGHVTAHGSVWAINTGPQSMPSGIAAGSDRAMWFSDAGRNAIRRVSFDRQLRDFPLPTRRGAPGPEVGAAPSGITAGPDGAMWFVETSADKLGRITVDGRITEFPIPRGEAYHAHPEDIALGPDGALWFTQLYKDAIGRFDPKTHRFSEVKVPLDPRTGLGPRSIHAGPDGVWFTQKPNLVGRIGRDGTLRIRDLPRGATVEAMASGSDGKMWLADPVHGKLLALRSNATVATTVELPASDARGTEFWRVTNTLGRPDSIVTGPDGAIWVSLPVTGRLARYGCDPEP
jgi:virginiamycin B lyase